MRYELEGRWLQIDIDSLFVKTIQEFLDSYIPSKKVHVKDLLKLVGYERGSVTPVGVKKNKGICFDSEVMDHEMIEISAGAYGYGLKVRRDDLLGYLKAQVSDLVKDRS